jgi:O-methyltransferase involved in polyketide biosynthesis
MRVSSIATPLSVTAGWKTAATYPLTTTTTTTIPVWSPARHSSWHRFNVPGHHCHENYQRLHRRQRLAPLYGSSSSSTSTPSSYTTIVALERQGARTQRLRRPPPSGKGLVGKTPQNGKEDNDLEGNHNQEEENSKNLVVLLLPFVQGLFSLVTFGIGIGMGAFLVILVVLRQWVTSATLYSSSSDKNDSAVLNSSVTTTDADTTTTTTTASTGRHDSNSIHSNNIATNNNNISTSLEEGGSRTAILALYGRLQAYYMLRGPDFLAATFLTAAAATNTPRPTNDNANIAEHHSTASSGTALQLLAVCGWLSRVNFHLTGAVFEDQVAFLATLGHTGLVTPLHCRTCFLDDCVETFVRSLQPPPPPSSSSNDSSRGSNHRHQNTSQGRNDISPKKRGGGNLILLGSGWDSRCHRLEERLLAAKVRRYEVDASGTLAAKRAIIQEVNRRMKQQGSTVDTTTTFATKTSSGDHNTKNDANNSTNDMDDSFQNEIQYCACDFETQNWLEVLQQVGNDSQETQFDPTLPTLVVWEGVTMYLSEETIVQTLAGIASSSSSSTSTSTSMSSPWYIAFDYVNASWAKSRLWQYGMKRVKEPFQFAGITPEQINALVKESGLSVLEHMTDPLEFQRRYVPQSAWGGIVGDYGGFVVAGNCPSKQECSPAKKKP